MDIDAVVENVNSISGLEGVKSLLDCIWCVGEKRDSVLKFIVNKYGFVDLNKAEDKKKLPTFIEHKPLTKSASCDMSIRAKLAKKHKVSPSKVKPAGNGRFIIRGRLITVDEVNEVKNS